MEIYMMHIVVPTVIIIWSIYCVYLSVKWLTWLGALNPMPVPTTIPSHGNNLIGCLQYGNLYDAHCCSNGHHHMVNILCLFIRQMVDVAWGLKPNAGSYDNPKPR